MKNTVFHNQHKKMVNQFIKEGKSLVYVINYLFSCCYNVNDVIDILTNRYHCRLDLLLDTLETDYKISIGGNI